MLLYAEKYLSTVVFHLLYKVDSTHCGSADGLCSVLLVSYLSLHQYHIASISCYVVVVQLLSHVHLFVTPWTAARQASLFFTVSWSLLSHVHWVDDAIHLSHPLSLASLQPRNMDYFSICFMLSLISLMNVLTVFCSLLFLSPEVGLFLGMLFLLQR